MIIGIIISLIYEKGKIQSALDLSQQNREQLLRTESVTESLLLAEARFKEYCTTFEKPVFEEYKTRVATLAENIESLQQTLSKKTEGNDLRITNIFEEKTKEADIYAWLRQVTDSLIYSVGGLEENQNEIEKYLGDGSGGRVDTLSITERRVGYKKGLLEKIKSAIIGEKIQQDVNTKLRIQSHAERNKLINDLLRTSQTQKATANSTNIRELVLKNYELKESELKLIEINNNLIAEIHGLVDEVKSRIKDEETRQNNSFLKSVRHSTGIFQNILIVLMLLACILAVYIMILAYKNDAFQENIIALNNKVMKDSIEKDKFFSIISHDLMNPFNTLLGFSNMLNDAAKEGNKEEFEECSSFIHQSAKRIYNLLENLLLWSRMQNGKMEFCPKTTRIDQLISDTMTIMAPLARNKEITLQWKVDNDITADVDANMLGSVLQNLVTNAIKFTDRGGKVIVKTFVEPDNLNIVVSDNGTGMTEDQVNKLFRLDRTHSSRGTDDETGTGLGLIISKEFIELHKGKLWAESTVGKGSNFHISIPS